MKTQIVKVNEVEIESLIKRNFSREFMKKIYDIYSDDYMSIVEKTITFDRLFTEEFGNRKDYRRIGEGTNRFVCLLDNHIIKVAYNYLAYIDNMNELAQAKYKEKYLAQAYETNGIILVSEYVSVMDKEEFLENQLAISKILDRLEVEFDEKKGKIGKKFILGDMGMSEKNYGNWGKRMNGEIVVLDYGYLYELQIDEWKEVAKCPICGSSLGYKEDYSELVCEKEECKAKVQYTTLRNNFGYANIVKNIIKNINIDKYVKFDENGKIVVDVMDIIEIEEEEKEEYKLPEEVVDKINLTMEKFFEMAECIKRDGELNVFCQRKVKDDLFDEKDIYDEILFPCLIAAINLTDKNIEKYLKDFNKKAKMRYDELYNAGKKEFETEEIIDDEIPDCIDTFEGYNVRGFESEIKIVDTVDDNVRKVTSLDDLLGSAVDDCFNNLFMADENEDKMNKADIKPGFTLDEILETLGMEDNEEEKNDEITIEERLENSYNDMVKSLTDIIETYYIRCGYKDEDYAEGDVYRTYFNGEMIDFDYSPEVNAVNILGGWEPDKFAFPLYRHLIQKYDYDMDRVNDEFEAIYRIDQSVEIPEDLYGKLENRNITISQIMNRFEDNKPARHVFVTGLGKALNEYYEAVDEYYESNKVIESDLAIDHPDYYLRLHENNESLGVFMRDARMNLINELANEGIRYEDVKDDNRIVYYYDLESIMNNRELDMYNTIRRMRFRDTKDIKNVISNEYYMEYRNIIPDSIFDIFRYGSSIVKEEGCRSYARTYKPEIRAKLVSKDSDEDGYKPELFSRVKYIRIMVEQRYEILISTNDTEDLDKLNDLKRDMNSKDIYYTEEDIYKYRIRNSKDNLRFLLTEKEIELKNEYERLLGLAEVKDIDKEFSKAVVEVMCRTMEINDETKEFLKDLSEFDLSEACANRLFKINVLEMSGTMSRIEYLKSIEG